MKRNIEMQIEIQTLNFVDLYKIRFFQFCERYVVLDLETTLRISITVVWMQINVYLILICYIFFELEPYLFIDFFYCWRNGCRMILSQGSRALQLKIPNVVPKFNKLWHRLTINRNYLPKAANKSATASQIIIFLPRMAENDSHLWLFENSSRGRICEI